jgi:hypothetical protein
MFSSAAFFSLDSSAVSAVLAQIKAATHPTKVHPRKMFRAIMPLSELTLRLWATSRG